MRGGHGKEEHQAKERLTSEWPAASKRTDRFKRGLGAWDWGYVGIMWGYYPPVMEKQKDKRKEHEMETGVQGFGLLLMNLEFHFFLK